MLRLEPRAQPSQLWRYASPLLALAITVVLGVILFMALGKDPVRGLQVFFWEPIKSVYALSELMVKATPLLLIALGLAVCFRSNVWNIGAEGQFVMGAVFAAGVALMADADTGAGFWVLILLAGMVGGLVWAGAGTAGRPGCQSHDGRGIKALRLSGPRGARPGDRHTDDVTAV